MSKIEVREEEISDSWKKKFNTDCKAFHVPLPSIKHHKEDLDRFNRSRAQGYKGGVRFANEEIHVDVKLGQPVIKYRKGQA